MYEIRNGKLFLLGVEYVVFVGDWFKDPSTRTRRRSWGSCSPAATSSPNRFNLPAFYALRVWAWRENPRGTFVDWNPQVSCDGFKSDQ